MNNEIHTSKYLDINSVKQKINSDTEMIPHEEECNTKLSSTEIFIKSEMIIDDREKACHNINDKSLNPARTNVATKSFKCDHCKKVFIKQGNLRKHLAFHFDECHLREIQIETTNDRECIIKKRKIRKTVEAINAAEHMVKATKDILDERIENDKINGDVVSSPEKRSEETKTDYLKAQRVLKLSKETPSERDIRLRKMRERMAKKVASETPEEREIRLQRMRERMAKKVAVETAEAREVRLQRMRERMARKVASETPDERQIRLQKMRERMAKKVSSETPEQKEERLQKMRDRMAMKRYSYYAIVGNVDVSINEDD